MLSYWELSGLLSGLAIVSLFRFARAAMRWSRAWPVAVMQRVESGSVNDYAAYLVAGVVVTVAVVAH